LKRWRANALLVLFSLLFSLLLAEGALRFVGYSNPPLYIYDDDLGSRLRPNAEGLWSKEGYAYIRINSDGLRDFEYTIHKPEDVYRIAVLGDSYMEALQVDLEKSFTKLLEKKLQVLGFEADSRIEVINFGTSGYGTAREMIMLQKHAMRYEPDMVILALLTGNDIRNNSEALEGIDSIPYILLNEQGDLVLDTSFRTSKRATSNSGWKRALYHDYLHHLRLAQLGNAVRRSLYQSRTRDGAELKANAGAGAELGLDENVYRPPADELWDYAWRTTEAILLEMNRVLLEARVRFLVVTLSNGIQVHPDSREKQKFMVRLGLENLYYPDERIRAFLRRNGVEVVSLAPELAKLAQTRSIFLHGFENTELGGGHWNADGHEAAAEIVSQWLVDKDRRSISSAE